MACTPFAPFGLFEGRHFMEFDHVHLSHELFWGARHFDGRGFDTEANRPAHLQIPLARMWKHETAPQARAAQKREPLEGQNNVPRVLA